MDASKLKDIPLFAGLSDHDRATVARWADEVDVAEGKHLVDQGRFAYEFFAILEGTADVTQDGRHLADLGPGDIFGEVGLLGDHVRSATVVSTSPMRVVVMLDRDFKSMERDLPQVAGRVRAVCQERTRDALAE
jgi:CRP-like cAMP-binding protein